MTALAKEKNIPVFAFGGIVENIDNLHELGITHIFSIRPESVPIEQAMTEAKRLLQDKVEKVMREYKMHTQT